MRTYSTAIIYDRTECCIKSIISEPVSCMYTLSFQIYDRQKCSTCMWHFWSIFPGEKVLDASGTSLQWHPSYYKIQNLLATFLCRATDWQQAEAFRKCVSLSKLPGVRLRGSNCLIKTSLSLTIPSAPSLIPVCPCSLTANLWLACGCFGFSKLWVWIVMGNTVQWS